MPLYYALHPPGTPSLYTCSFQPTLRVLPVTEEPAAACSHPACVRNTLHFTARAASHHPAAPHCSSCCCLCCQDAGSADLLDLLLGQLAEELCLHHHWLLGQLALAQHLEHTILGDVNDRGTGLVLGSSNTGLQHTAQDVTHNRPNSSSSGTRSDCYSPQPLSQQSVIF